MWCWYTRIPVACIAERGASDDSDELETRKRGRSTLCRLSIRQSDTVLANCHNAKVAVSVRPMPLRLNLLASDVDTLVNYALHYCNHECLNTEQEARRCPLRGVYGLIPGMEGSADAMGMCPYMGQGEEA